MKVHLINKGLLMRYLNDNPKAKKSLSIWMAIMNHADWNRVSDIDQTFGLPFISKEQREVRFDISASNVTITCLYRFHTSRVHILIQDIRTNEVQSN